VPKRAPVRRFGLLAPLILAGLLTTVAVGAPSVQGATYPPLPLAQDRWFVSNLTGAEIAPGSGGTLTLQVADPLSAAMTSTVLTVGVYAFNAFPGNATSSVEVSSAPVISNGSASGLEINESLGSIAPGQHAPVSVPVQSSASTPAGTFAVRVALRFDQNGSTFLLESRGWFTAATWAGATAGPNGSADVNLTALGVSGIVPETSILVQSNDFTYVIGGILAAGIAVIGVGTWLYFRRSNSRSGTRPAPVDTQAPTAFGSRRTSDGD
jgi:hypothetical protein